MPRGHKPLAKKFAIVVRDLSEIDQDLYQWLQARKFNWHIFYFENHLERNIPNASKVLPPESTHRTTYSYYLCLSVLFSVSQLSPTHILFYDCPELATAILRMKYLQPHFSNSIIAVGSKDGFLKKNPTDPEKDFLANESVCISTHLIPLSIEGVNSLLDTSLSTKQRTLQKRVSITVGICHYDRLDYLKLCLKGFSEQTDKRFHILVFDDSSPDQESIRTYANSLIQDQNISIEFVFSKNNVGPGRARNWLAKHASTSHILFFDDDNIPKPEMMACFHYAASTTNFDALSCGYQSFMNVGGEKVYGSDVYFLGPNIHYALRENCLGDTCTLFNRDAFWEVGGFTEESDILFEDWKLLLKFLLLGKKIRSLPMTLFEYRHHQQQRSFSGDSKKSILRLKNLAAIFGQTLIVDAHQPSLSEYNSGWKNFKYPVL